jgi:hypothetical protein
MKRGVQTFVASIFLLAALAVSALWVRSYRWTDDGPIAKFGSWSWEGGSSVGQLAAGVEIGTSLAQWHHAPVQDVAAEQQRIATVFSGRLGFGTRATGGRYAVMCPDWFVVLVCLGLAAAARWRLTFRFSLRVLFTVMTLLAAVLSAAVVLSR